jgi:hypothetical protein
MDRDMTVEFGLGLSLSEARIARGLTLEDAERTTRISRKFLVALEQHHYSAFPAPVYARGFLRTYCRYLGLDPEIQLAELPAGWSSQMPATHLPSVARRFALNKWWIFAAAPRGGPDWASSSRGWTQVVLPNLGGVSLQAGTLPGAREHRIPVR